MQQSLIYVKRGKQALNVSDVYQLDVALVRNVVIQKNTLNATLKSSWNDASTYCVQVSLKDKIRNGCERSWEMEKDLIKKENKMSANYHRTKMQKEIVLQRLKENGCRITKQRKILLDIILQEECASCKEIYYKASKADSSIGVATVYRMVNLLEEIGAINRKNMYRISCGMNCDKENACVIELDDHTTCRLSSGEWYKVISEGLKCLGYVSVQKVTSVVVEPCEKECI